MAKKRYCVVGASGRATTMYVESLAKQHTEYAELCGIFDINPGRAAYVAKTYGNDCPVYTDFDLMLAEQKPDKIIVVCVDYKHAEYVVRGLAAGADVFCEKPMCINAEQAEEILAAEKKYGRRIGVCFNMRFYDTVLEIKRLLAKGVIGDIFTANLEWTLAAPKVNGGHGASYYHRWNSELWQSGGLLITKATHHFDMANWFIGQHPVRVSAFGKRRMYGPENAPYTGERCRDCAHVDDCPFSWGRGDEERKHMFFDNEKYDGYIVDSCVWRDKVDAYDCMSLSVEYDGGAVMSYTESTAAAYEGWKMTLNGSKGRMEIACYDRNAGGIRPDENIDLIRVIDMDNNITTYPMPAPRTGSHGGSDWDLRQCLFEGAEPEFPDQLATSLEGAYSILIGAAANESIKTGKIITLRDMFQDPTLLDR